MWLLECLVWFLMGYLIAGPAVHDYRAGLRPFDRWEG